MWLKTRMPSMKKSNGSFVKGWTTLQRDRGDVHLIEAALTKEIIETGAQEAASI